MADTIDGCLSVNMDSAVSARAGCFRFMVHVGAVDSRYICTFLQCLLVGIKPPVFMIVDSRPAHHTHVVRDYVASINYRLRLFFLRSYSPQLNPDEAVWSHITRDLIKRGIENLERMKRVAIGALRRIHKLP